MKRTMLFVAAFVLLTCGGCDPFETELTLNADGSGKMVQKATLTPMAVMVAMQPRSGYSPILSEDAAKDWQQACEQSGVKLVSYSCSRSEDGTLQVACEVSFTDVKEFAESVWGFPFQLSSTPTEGGMQLNVGDPAQFVVSRSIRDELGIDRPTENESRDQKVQRLAFMDGAARLMNGMRLRTVVHLPADGRRVEGGVLSADNATMTLQSIVGANGLTPEQFLLQAPASVFLPAGALPLAAFVTPNQPVTRTIDTAPPTERKEFKAQLSRISSIRSALFARAGESPTTEGHLELHFEANGPHDVSFADTSDSFGLDRPNSIITVLKDEKGNDLRADATLGFMPKFTLAWNFAPRTTSTRHDEDRLIGHASISLKPRNEWPRRLTVEGYFVGRTVSKLGHREIKPLKDNLDTPITAGDVTFTLTELAERTVKYDWTEPIGERGVPSSSANLQFFTGDGTEVHYGGKSGRGSVDTTSYELEFQEPLPDDVCAVITWPEKFEDIKMPFSLTDVPVP